MAELVQNQLDYILFLTGLAFVVLGSVCFILRRMPGPPLPWIRLAWFGVLFGLSEWLEVVTIGLGEVPFLSALRSVLLAGSVLLLMGFSCGGLLNRLIPSDRTRMLFWLLPLGVLVLAMQGGGVKEYELAGFFLLAAASTYSSLMVWNTARASRAARSAIGLTALSMVLLAFGFLAAVPRGSCFPASILNRDVFLAFVGFPPSCVHAVLACVLAAALWQCYQYLERASAVEFAPKPATHFGLQMAVALALLSAGGWVAADWAGRHETRMLDEHILARAKVAANALPIDWARKLTGTPADAHLPEYRRLRRQLSLIQQSNPDIHNVYLYGPRQGGSINYVASEVGNPAAEVAPGDVYAAQLDPEDVKFFSDGIPYVSDPYTDRWGTWISAIVGIIGAEGSRPPIRVALGMDLSAREVHQSVASSRLIAILLVLLVSILTINLFVFRRHWWDRTRQSVLHQNVLLHLSRQDHTDFHSAIERVTRASAYALNVGRLSVWRFVDDGAAALCEDVFILNGNHHERGMRLAAGQVRRFVEALEQERTLSVASARTDPRTCDLAADYLEPMGIASLLGALILRDGRSVGVVLAEQTEIARRWTVEERDFATAIAEMVTLLIEAAERRQIEMENFESQERYRRIFERSPETIVLLDPQGRVMEMNRRGLELVGHPAEAIVGKSIMDWPHLTPESKTLAQDRLLRRLRGEEVPPYELEFVTQAGQRLVGVIYATALHDRHGELMGILVMISDITERKKAEEKLRNTLDALERHNRLMIGRETRVVELKKEVNALLRELGRPAGYPSVDSDPSA